MEVLFNLIWLALSVSLLGLWLRGQHRGADESPRTSTRMQIIALAVLIVILLPVVSLTDDLQACTAPTEVEHLARRDLQSHVGSPLHTESVVVAALISFQRAFGLQTQSHPANSVKIATLDKRYLSVIGNRPPPGA